MRRCASLDRIVDKGAFPACSCVRRYRLGSVAELEGLVKKSGSQGTRNRLKSIYLDLLLRKGHTA